MKNWLKKKLEKFLEIDEIKGSINNLNVTTSSLYNEIAELSITANSLHDQVGSLRDEVEIEVGSLRNEIEIKGD